MTDPIADLLTRIRNAQRARHQTVSLPSSKMKEAIVKILKDEGYISQYIKENVKLKTQLKIFLKYEANRQGVIREIRRVSCPGGRVYRGFRELKPYLRGLGTMIVSTPQGVMTESSARKAKVGGEVLCRIW